jgi:arginine/ornithine transport system substrate-binding protein
MKKFLSVLIVLCLVLVAGNAFAKDWKTIRVGVEGAYPPFSLMTPDGKLEGFDIDIANALGKAAGAKVKLVMQDWDGMIPGLLARKFDCIVASMSITEERKKAVAFTDKYYQTPAKFIAKKGLIRNFSKNSIRGKTVGVQRATIHDQYLTDNYGSDVRIKRYGSLDDIYLDIAAGRLDLLMADSVAADEGFLSKPHGRNYEFVGPGMTDPKWFGDGIGIACRKGDRTLVRKLNAAIKKIRRDGTYNRIQKKYFDFDIYGD